MSSLTPRLLLSPSYCTNDAIYVDDLCDKTHDRQLLTSIAATHFHDNVPVLATSRFSRQVIYNADIIDTNGVVINRSLHWIFEKFGGVIGSLSNNELTRKQEKQYKQKMGPRNVFLTQHFRKRLWLGFQPTAVIDVPQWDEALDITDRIACLGRSLGRSQVKYIQPPKENASSGINLFGNRLVISSKGEKWALFQDETKQILEKILSDDGLDFGLVYDEDYMAQIAAKYACFFSLLTRTDGGPTSPRVIWNAPAWEYILEMYFFGSNVHGTDYLMSYDIKQSPFVYTQPDKAFAYLDDITGEWFWSADCSRWDLRWKYRFIVDALIHLGRLYHVPERVMVVLIASNAYGYVLTWDYWSKPIFARPDGVIKSGTGVFVKIGHYLRMALNIWTCIRLGLQPDPGLVLGDDSVLRGLTPADVKIVCKWLEFYFNVKMKVPAQIISKDGFTLCRQVFQYGVETVRPTYWSLVRNLLFPEREYISQYVYALRCRALMACYTSGVANAATFNFADKMTALIGIESTLPELDLSELMSNCPDASVESYYLTVSPFVR